MARVIFLAMLMLGMMIVAPQPVWADEEIEDMEEVSDVTRADDWFTKQRNSTREGLRGYGSSDKGYSYRDANGNIPRYVRIHIDESFIYWLDTQYVRWMDMPYSTTESIIDVWVRMEDISEDREYSYPEKYYMEHLYLRPAKQQVQFLSELEITGRPQNNIRERPYKAEHWENLVPGSAEEHIYHATMGLMKELERDGRVRKKKSDYDFWDDTLRIGGIF